MATGSGNSFLSTPKFLRMALLPIPCGLSESKSISTASPGLASRTTIGPVIGVRG